MRRTAVVAAGVASLLAVSFTSISARQQGAAIAVDADDVGGVVRSSKGPEAGVWVIAETKDLPTPYVKIVVTDDQGRYLLPDLPKANYSVFVRGYGLVDSPRVSATPGKALNLTAVIAPNEHAAAQYYPAGHWLSMLRIPEAGEFPGTGPQGNGINPNVKSQAEWMRMIKSGGCTACHQLGTKGTREIPKELGTFPSRSHAWERRLASGQAGGQMINGLNNLGRERALLLFADWTDRINRGEVPPAPPRPQGVERNVVITMWDWADPKAYLHDVVSTDRRNPTLNANGLLYGALELSADYVPVLDPKTNTISRIPLSVRDPNTPPTSPKMAGAVAVLRRRSDLDQQEQRPQPDARREGPPVAHLGGAAGRESGVLQGRVDSSVGESVPAASAAAGTCRCTIRRRKKLTHIATCFGTHHLMFAEDANNTLWTSGGGQVVGWLNRKMFDETGDEEKSQGWTALIMDTNGNGRRDAYVEPDQPVDPTKDKRFGAAFYSVAPAPDGAIWGSVLGYPGQVVRLVPGSNPPETALAEVYEPPFNDKVRPGFSPRGADVDRNGVFWSALASGHLASFDRRKCKGPLNGPKATGQHCPEGWTLYTEPAPQFRGVKDGGSVEGSYYTWVDQFDALGLGANTPINTGNASEGLLALKDGKWVVLRIPYPTGFYTKWMDGRIDDPKGGWKGRGLWATISTRTPFHMETGKGTTSKVYHVQLRPDPLAK